MSLDSFQHLNLQLEDGGILLLRLEHGKANECGSEIIGELEQLAELVGNRSDITALVTYSDRVTRSGKPVFIAGANVTERTGWSDDRVKQHVRRQRAALRALRNLPVMHIAVVNGLALGLGVEFLLTVDYRIALDSASFALPETGLGILPGALGTALLADTIGLPQALRLGMTGERIRADEALRIGLVQETATDGPTGLQRARTLAKAVATRSPRAVAAFKSAALRGLGQDEATRVGLEAAAYEQMVDCGEAAIGRTNFARIRAGEAPDWPPRQ